MKAAVVVSVLVVVLAVAGYNEYSAVRADLVRQREAIDSEWSQVDIAFERRAELIPNVLPPELRTDSGAALWGELESASATMAAARTPKEKIQANNRVTELLATLPKGGSTTALQRLSDAENRIAVERRRYNEMLEHYNAQIQRFPDNIVASIAGFERDDAYLPTDAGVQH